MITAAAFRVRVSVGNDVFLGSAGFVWNKYWVRHLVFVVLQGRRQQDQYYQQGFGSQHIMHMLTE